MTEIMTQPTRSTYDVMAGNQLAVLENRFLNMIDLGAIATIEKGEVYYTHLSDGLRKQDFARFAPMDDGRAKSIVTALHSRVSFYVSKHGGYRNGCMPREVVETFHKDMILKAFSPNSQELTPAYHDSIRSLKFILDHTQPALPEDTLELRALEAASDIWMCGEPDCAQPEESIA